MLIGMYPTLLNTQGLPVSVSLFEFLASDSLEELKPFAVQEAQEKNKRQFIALLGSRYVLIDTHWRASEYFQACPIVAQFAKSGKETTRKKKNHENKNYQVA